MNGTCTVTYIADKSVSLFVPRSSFLQKYYVMYVYKRQLCTEQAYLCLVLCIISLPNTMAVLWQNCALDSNVIVSSDVYLQTWLHFIMETVTRDFFSFFF
jgi:hypothetical protein